MPDIIPLSNLKEFLMKFNKIYLYLIVSTACFYSAIIASAAYSDLFGKVSAACLYGFIIEKIKIKKFFYRLIIILGLMILFSALITKIKTML